MCGLPLASINWSVSQLNDRTSSEEDGLCQGIITTLGRCVYIS